MRAFLILSTVLCGCNTPKATPASAQPDLAPREICAHPPSAALIAKQEMNNAIGTSCEQIAAAVAAGKAIDYSTAPTPVVATDIRPGIDKAAQPAYGCRAVATDDDAPCAQIPAGDPRIECGLERAFFHAARTPGDPAWRFPDAWHARCKSAGLGAACDRYREALRARDASRCPKELADCVALATGDASKCGNDRECTRRVKRYELVGTGGLAKLASDGDEGDKLFAKAALGQPGACDATKEMVLQACRAAVNPEQRDGGSQK